MNIKSLLKFKYILTSFLVCLFLFSNINTLNAQSPSPTPVPSSSDSSQVQDLQNKINELQSKISELQTQEKTLSSQITVMDNQIKLTELKIDSTKQQISNLTLDIDTADKKIDKLEGSLDNLSKILINRIKETYITGTTSSFQILISSSNVSDFVKKANYLRIAQLHDKRLIYDTVQAKNDYSNQKDIFEDKKATVEKLQVDLTAYSTQVEVEKESKNRLLAETQGSEANYQRLLAQAKAEYEAIVGIVAGKGIESQVREVKKGDVVASVIGGASCNSSGAHLHFTVLEGGGAINPFNKLKDVSRVDYTGGDSWSPSGDWDWPLSPTIQFNQGFGATTCVTSGWCGRIYSSHNGLDISSSSNTVYSVADGTMYKGSYTVGCTLPYVRVKHKDSNIDTLYLHVYSN